MKSAGSTGTLIALSSTFAAQSAAAKSEAVDEKIAQLLRDGKLAEAKRLLENNNRDYSVRESTRPSFGPRPEGHYTQDDSSFSLVVSESGGTDEYLITANARVKARQISARDAAIVDDTLGVTFAGSQFTMIRPNDRYLYAGSSAGSTSISISDDDYNKGLLTRINLPYTLSAPTTVTMQFHVEKIGTVTNAPVRMSYSHNWALLDPGKLVTAYLEANGSLPAQILLAFSNASTLWEEVIPNGNYQ